MGRRPITLVTGPMGPLRPYGVGAAHTYFSYRPAACNRIYYPLLGLWPSNLVTVCAPHTPFSIGPEAQYSVVVSTDRAPPYPYP